MVGNKQAYEEGYQRGLAGKSSRSLLALLMAPFEDNYTRQSRQKGERDGAAARQAGAGAGAAPEAAAPPHP